MLFVCYYWDMDIFKTFELFLTSPLSVIHKRIIRIMHVEGNIFSKKLPVQLETEDNSAQITVYNNENVYRLLSNVIYKKKFFNENNHRKVCN